MKLATFRPGLTAGTALAIIVLSVGTAVTRRAIVGEDIDGPPGTGSWRITMVATGTLRGDDASLVTSLPLDFRQQRILADEPFSCEDLEPRPVKSKEVGLDRTLWRPAKPTPATTFRLTGTYRAVVGVHQPTRTMRARTQDFDHKENTVKESLPEKSTSVIQHEGKVKAKADEILADVTSPRDIDKIRALFKFVRDEIGPDPTLAVQTALDCLRSLSGDSTGKSRLLVGLCRSQQIPARIVTGLVLGDDQQPRIHRWVEAWVKDTVHEHWLPMCPINDHFGLHDIPDEYFVLSLGDDEPVTARGGDVKYGFVVKNLHNSSERFVDQKPSRLKSFLLRVQLTSLRHSDKNVVEFLLLLPLAALMVSIFRTVVGVPTYGTFSPALVGLAFLDLKALPVGLGVFTATILAGWYMRRVLERYHLLQVPRTAALLTMIVAMLLFALIIAANLGAVVTNVISLFPLVILTHLVERFWTVEAEDSTTASFKVLLGTLIVSVSISLSLSHDWLTLWLLRYPETLGIIFAVQILLGRYTGYRLSELIRFADLLKQQTPAGATP